MQALRARLRHKPIEIPFGKKWILSWYAKNAAGDVADDGVWCPLFTLQTIHIQTCLL